MEFQIRIHPEQRLTRIPKILAKNFGHVWTLVPNTQAAIIFPENADLQTVLESLGIIEQDLRLRIESERRKAPGDPKMTRVPRERWSSAGQLLHPYSQERKEGERGQES